MIAVRFAMPAGRPASRAFALASRTLALVLVLGRAPVPAGAQVVSPGRLTTAHAELEGLRKCTDCHELGREGVAPERCLSCHRPLAERIARGTGYHGRLEERDCAVCHREHLGREADLIRLDTAAFEHGVTGFELRGAHAATSCRSCHRSELVVAPDVRAHQGRPGFLARTLLGLPARCDGCHRAENPHGAQFGARSCDGCHDEERWHGASRFDHDAIRFRLTGAHRAVGCAACHPPGPRGEDARWADVPHASCAACHGDPHRDAMGGECRGCHTTEGWRRVARQALEGRFDHDRTGLPLRGAHADLECAACHRARSGAGLRIRIVPGTEAFTYPRPAGRACAFCHHDPHGGELPEGCESCHSDAGWLPTTYGPDRHRGTAFALEGAHAAVPCGECHLMSAAEGGPGLRFGLDATCRACHGAEDPHAGRYGERPCEACHTSERFTLARFDHAAVEAGSCRSCHGWDDPHGDQFGARPCDACHSVTSFWIAGFDHSATGFALQGAHAGVACVRCHPTEWARDGRVVVRYRPLDATCQSCHGGIL